MLTFGTAFTYLFTEPIFIDHPSQARYHVRHLSSTSLVFIKQLFIKWNVPVNLLLSFLSPLTADYSISYN